MRGNSGGWDRTNDLQFMRLTSYCCSTPQTFNSVAKELNFATTVMSRLSALQPIRPLIIHRPIQSIRSTIHAFLYRFSKLFSGRDRSKHYPYK